MKSKSFSTVGPDTVRFALEAAGQVMFEFDPKTNTVLWADEQAAAETLGFALKGHRNLYTAILAAVSPEDAMRRGAEVTNARSERRSYTVEFRAENAEGAIRWFEERGSWIRSGGRERLVGLLRRIDAQKSREEQLTYLAAHDELTGHLNRARTKRALTQLILDEERAKDNTFYMVGIDNIGGINVSFGFDAADEVIRTVAARLAECLGPNMVCGRIAGTKFGIIAPDAAPETVRERAMALLNAVRAEPIVTRAGAIQVSICLGAVPLKDEIDSPDAAIARAEAALDQARQAGPSNWSTFTATTDPVTLRHRDVETSDLILTALNERRVGIAFQPIVTDVGAPQSKFECLIRLTDADGQEIPAPHFIAAAERMNLIHLLDRRVLELATIALHRNPDIELAVNVSWETVKDPVWADGYVAHLRANAHLCERITVELTETRIVDAIEASEEFVTRIKSLGVRFALDDFGAGYTSFRNLKALDIDILKIDGSFITGLAESRENQLFVRTLIDLARNFGMKTVAEWVDNEQDARILKALGVDFLQGFYIGKGIRRPEWTDRLPADAQAEVARKAEAR
ncbi:MAG: EAL domain-containing protein [Parvularcula sp.]|jgi:diguanylate cyclase (GGDEF)-like protein/PAS domain S-box-containing protein|nr:EAL domain-containing protein [Parvularcula sp.]